MAQGPTGNRTVPPPAALRHRAGAIRERDVGSHAIAYLPDSWRQKVPSAEVEHLVDEFKEGAIRRCDLFRLGDRARNGSAADRRCLLVGTMMWGYGVRGGRSYRNAKLALADTTLDDRLLNCTDAINREDPRAAYVALKGLHGYDEGFFTKFLYFAARNATWGNQAARPLIFDSVVRNALQFLAQAHGADWQALLPPRTSRVVRYLHYCETAERWAEELQSDGEPCTADQVEAFLFESTGIWFDTAAELRRLTTAVLADAGASAIGPRTSAALAALPPDLVASCAETQRL